MTALARRSGLADSLADIFAPVDDGPIAALLAEHVEHRAAIERLTACFTEPGAAAALAYYNTGNEVRDGYTVERMFNDEGCKLAIKALDADYWRRALDATDVLSTMPAKRREEWGKQLSERNVPPFDETTLRATLGEHLALRASYFAERIDGLFRSLSPDHRTNIAAGFRSKMIIAGLTESAFYMSSRLDYLVDLRVVVAKFMGRELDDEYKLRSLTERLVRYARDMKRGQWVTVDGGAIELRMYGNGNAHIRVHDEIAWRLNAVLASVNPGCIPESNRTRPAYSGKRKSTASGAGPRLFLRPLPFAVLDTLRRFASTNRRAGTADWEYSPSYDWKNVDRHVRREAIDVLASIGGVEVKRWDGDGGRVSFDFDPTEAIAEILASGAVPDQRAHQYYPTPDSIAHRVVTLAELDYDETVLEPSAGQGALVQAALDACDVQVLAVEVSGLHVKVLESRFAEAGCVEIAQGDFLQMTSRDLLHLGIHEVNCVLMNPPFDRGQWARHVEHAASFVRPGGRIIAVAPTSACDRVNLPGFAITWHDTGTSYPGVSIRVQIMKAVRQ